MYLKTIKKSKTLAATLSDIKLEDNSNNEDDEILNAFTTTEKEFPIGSKCLSIKQGESHLKARKITPLLFQQRIKRVSYTVNLHN